MLTYFGNNEKLLTRTTFVLTVWVNHYHLTSSHDLMTIMSARAVTLWLALHQGSEWLHFYRKVRNMCITFDRKSTPSPVTVSWTYDVGIYDYTISRVFHHDCKSCLLSKHVKKDTEHLKTLCSMTRANQIFLRTYMLNVLFHIYNFIEYKNLVPKCG